MTTRVGVIGADLVRAFVGAVKPVLGYEPLAPTLHEWVSLVRDIGEHGQRHPES